MAQRIYLSPLVGDGTANNPYRPKIADMGVPWVGVLASNANGSPKFNWAIVLVSADDLTSLDGDATLDAFPNVNANTPIASLAIATRNQLQNGITGRGIGVTIANHATVKDVIEAVGRVQNPQFSLKSFSIS